MAGATKNGVLELPGKLAASRLQSQAKFLNLISKLRPHVIGALYETSMREFTSVVQDHFQSAIRPELVRDAFRFSTSLKGKKTQTLRRKIRGWARNWNLDAEWCRDHALCALREWLFMEPLSRSQGFSKDRKAFEATGWSRAVGELEFNFGFSRAVNEHWHEQVIELEAFEFNLVRDWLGSPFRTKWKVTEESETEFKKRAKLEFRIHLNRIEFARLTALAADNDEAKAKLNALTTKQLGKELAWGKGLLVRFESQLADYTTRSRVRKQEAKTKHSFVDSASLPDNAYLEYLVYYQIPQADGDCLSYGQIAKLEHGSEINIRQRIKKTTITIGLSLRHRSMHAGRPLGTGKRITRRAQR